MVNVNVMDYGKRNEWDGLGSERSKKRHDQWSYNVTRVEAGVEIRIFCWTSQFWCWQKSQCSSPIATKGFVGAVSSLFDPALTGSFTHSRYTWRTA